MKFVSYVHAGRESYGLLQEDGSVLDVPAAAPGLPATLHGFIAAGGAALARAHALAPGRGVPARELRLLAPIPHPVKNVFCVGRNYKDHVAEGYLARGQETKLPEFPQFFTKPPTAVMGPDDEFPYDPGVTKALDYEVELAVVIGTTGRDIPREQAMAHVFGVTILNDITGRDLQRRHDQWFKGKGLDSSCPMGPFVLTLDAVPDLGAMELTTHVNGEARQRSQVRELIFDIPEIITQLSRGMTLEAGDIIATGTPSGVGYAMNPPRLLQAGDTVVCAITGLGHLTTRITAAGTPL